MQNFLWALFRGNFPVKFPCFFSASGTRSSTSSRPKAAAIMPRPLPDVMRTYAVSTGHTRQQDRQQVRPAIRRAAVSAGRRNGPADLGRGKSGIFPSGSSSRRPAGPQTIRTHAHASRPMQRQPRHKRHTRPPHPTAAGHQAGPPAHTTPHPIPHSTHHSTHRPNPTNNQPNQTPAIPPNAPAPASCPHTPAGDLNAHARRYWRASFKTCGFGSPKFW